MMHEEQQPEASQELRRLCSEIQLFDLCDLERCRYKQGRFCTRTELLARFEQIADEDECAPLRNTREDGGVDEEEDEDLDGYGSGNGEDEFDEEGYEREGD